MDKFTVKIHYRPLRAIMNCNEQFACRVNKDMYLFLTEYQHANVQMCSLNNTKTFHVSEFDKSDDPVN